MKTKDKLNGPALAAAIAVFGWSLVSNTAHAVTLSTNTDRVLVGMAQLSGGGMRIPVVCYRDNLNVERVVRLTGDYTGLSADLYLNLENGNDIVRFVRTSNYVAPSATDCVDALGEDLSSANWEPLDTNGHQVTIDGWLGDDEIEGLGASEDVIILGYQGYDFLYNYSSVGTVDGEDHGDDMVSSTTGGGDSLHGSGGTDCLMDTSNTVVAGGFDCGGAESDYYYSGNSSIQVDCDTSTWCCGFFCS